MWTVVEEWAPISSGWCPGETSETFPDYPPARRHAMQMACLRGVRYVVLLDPHQVIAGEYLRFTNVFRQYALHIGACDNFHEPEGPQCAGQLYARPDDVQVRCPRCAAWTGAGAPGMHWPYGSYLPPAVPPPGIRRTENRRRSL